MHDWGFPPIGRGVGAVSSTVSAAADPALQRSRAPAAPAPGGCRYRSYDLRPWAATSAAHLGLARADCSEPRLTDHRT